MYLGDGDQNFTNIWYLYSKIYFMSPPILATLKRTVNSETASIALLFEFSIQAVKTSLLAKAL